MAYYDKHTHKDAHVTINITKIAMGKELEGEVLNLDKAEMLSRMRTVYKKGELTTVNTIVENVEILDGGLRAKVRGGAKGDFMLKIPSPEGMREIPATQDMMCDDVLVMSDDNVIQTLESMCALMATMGAVESMTPTP
jgi:hypothetical protein